MTWRRAFDDPDSSGGMVLEVYFCLPDPSQPITLEPWKKAEIYGRQASRWPSTPRNVKLIHGHSIQQHMTVEKSWSCIQTFEKFTESLAEYLARVCGHAYPAHSHKNRSSVSGASLCEKPHPFVLVPASALLHWMTGTVSIAVA